MKRKLLFSYLFIFFTSTNFAQQSVARKWNEVLLNAIRSDYARPTVHARNLFHSSIALYDSWAVLEKDASTYFLGQTIDGYPCPYEGVDTPEDKQSAQEEIMSYAVFRLLNHRFKISPGATESLPEFETLFSSMGYDKNFTSTDYSSNSHAALGNYLAEQLITFGLQDGANEINEYSNEYYKPFNSTMLPAVAGNPTITDMNRWQPLSLDTYIDQSGHLLAKSTPDFLGPEWGNVTPFALSENELTVYQRNGNDYQVYYDPGPPPHLDKTGTKEDYQWGFSLVNQWASHLDPTDGVLWDISPASIGNIQNYPTTTSGLKTFYKQEGGDIGQGHDLNPSTNLPYDEHLVPRGDYSRVLAEFWADGPDSETPPGHWFTILNKVNDHPDFVKKHKGEGEIIEPLEWDVKAYFSLGGAMHDAAISAWGIKGWYDYLRPISAIRCMAQIGQSSDNSLTNYNSEGIPLIKGYIEIISPGDALAGPENINLGKVKLYTWKGHDYITDTDTDMAGVGWILAEEWWPYQRPSFVTPPFAGYISGHSVFSRAAAEVLTLLTGDAFFPGGMGSFEVKKNEFLVFEEGPSVDFTLQWATYRDASDQTSLSRIWGGIHPPVDDVPGRLIGKKIGVAAFAHAEQYFSDKVILNTLSENEIQLYPNPIVQGDKIFVQFSNKLQINSAMLFDVYGKEIKSVQHDTSSLYFTMDIQGVEPGIYFLKMNSGADSYSKRIIVFK
jgi:hypothetical protein